MFVPLEACSLRTIITFSLIVLVVAVQLRRWDIIKPTLVLLFVFSGSASSGVIRISMLPVHRLKTYIREGFVIKSAHSWAIS